MRRLVPAMLAACLLAACSGGRDAPPPAATDGIASLPAGTWKLGKPYKINGKWYYPQHDPAYRREGVASWYGQQFHGLSTANGEIFDKDLISAAHPTLPLPSLVKVTNLENGRELTLRVNDRGPFHDDRLIDLSQAAARDLGFEHKGLARVRVEFVAIAPDAIGVPPGTTMLAQAGGRSGPAAPPSEPLSDPLAPEPTVVATALSPPSGPPPREREPRLQLASLGAAPAAARCSVGPHYVQVGAFADTARVRAASARVAALGTVRMEPVFIGEHAAMRVRLGPTADRPGAERLLAKVRDQGYAEAYLVPVTPGAAARAC